jgi:hypothetical protein
MFLVRCDPELFTRAGMICFVAHLYLCPLIKDNPQLSTPGMGL